MSDFPKELRAPPHKINLGNADRAERPNLPARKPPRGGDRPEVQCPGCGAWRPSFSISRTKAGWLGDCCISDVRRRGRGREVD